MTTNKANERLAVHEAGHAVVGWVRGFRSDGIKLEYEKEHGTTYHKPPIDGLPEHTRDLTPEQTKKVVEFKRKYLAVRAAGHAAEALLRGMQDVKNLKLAETGSFSDLDNSLTDALGIWTFGGMKEEPDALLDGAMKDALRELKANWLLVRQLAAVLLERGGRMAGPEVDALLDSSRQQRAA